MGPEKEHFLWGVGIVKGTLQDALEDTAYVTDIEHVVEFARDWQQLFPYTLVEIQSCIDYPVRYLLDSLWKIPRHQESLQDRPKYFFKIRIRWLRQAQNHMMSDIPCVQLVPPTTGSGSTSNHGGINNLLPKQFLPIIKPLIVKKMSQEFNGRLRPFFL